MRCLLFLMADFYMWRRRIGIIAAVVMIMTTGCSNVKLSIGLSKNTFARINGEKIQMDSARLLLSEEKYSYEKLFNDDVWKESMGEVTVEEYVKDSVKDTLTQIKYLNLMAEDMDIVITNEEKQCIKMAAQTYCDESGAASVGVVEDFYTELLVGEKVFYGKTEGVDVQVSVDEARIINVQYIFFSTACMDDDGTYVTMSDEDKKKKLKLAEEVYEKTKVGNDFLSLAKEYSEDENYQLQLGREEYSEQFEKEAFSLEMGEISSVVTTGWGYYIIKCINDNVESDYDKRCEAVVMARRNKMFSSFYQEFADKSTCQYNEDFWQEESMKDIPAGTGKLYEIYNEYVKEIISTQSD